jgi:hypothetical protein
MSILTFGKKKLSPNKNESSSSNWKQYSDNYVSATGPNGHTVLASKSASILYNKKGYKLKKA